MKPLENLIVLEFCQYLSGPSAGLRLADLGARVIKIEEPGGGDGCRRLYWNNLAAGDDSVLFHTINRNKESFAADLNSPRDLEAVKRLIAKADVLIENFRPGTMAKYGLDYDSVRKINPRLVYGTITGYGKEGPWKDKPDQDLLVQSLSGLTWLNGNAGQPPVPFALAIVDILAGAFLVQGILACLARRGRTGGGGLVEVSLLETVLDFQFEVLTTYLNDGGQKPQRSAINNAHAYLGAPYGIYETKDGWLALAMGPLVRLAELLECPEAAAYTDPKTWFTRRDEIKAILARHLKTKTTREWLDVLEPADYWCAEVFDWEKLLSHEGFKALDMIQEIAAPGGGTLRTTRCPIRINGERLKSAKGAPALGEHNGRLAAEFGLPADAAQRPEASKGIHVLERPRAELPLEGVLVLDFSQFLSGPSAALKLADMGARVIKIENPPAGDICRTLYISNQELDGDSTLFHAINRNKESVAANLKDPKDREAVAELVRRADVIIQNFRPGVMKRLGFDYESVKAINPRIVYGEITGYGTSGPWVEKPGQDLLVQSLSGLTWLNGDHGQPPMPFGLAAADMIAGAHLAQGILAGLVRRSVTGEGCHVEVSLLESIIDLQFEVLTTYLNDGGRKPERSAVNNAHPYMGAPCGIYETADGWLALGSGPLTELAELVECPELGQFGEPDAPLKRRDDIKRAIARRLKTAATRVWLDRLEPAGYPCAEVLDWDRLMREEAFRMLNMTQTVYRRNGAALVTTRCPIRIDGRILTSPKGSPRVGEDREILAELLG